METAGYSTHLRAIVRSPGTVRVRLHYIERFLADTLLDPWNVTRDDVETWLAGMKWAASTRRSAIASLRDFYRWALERGYLATSPVAGIKPPRAYAPPPHPMDEDTYADALNRASGDLRWLLRILAETGIRRGECAQMHSRDVSGRWLTVHGKGGRVRRIPLPADLAAWIVARDGYTWPGRWGGHAPPDTITQRVRDHCGYGPHTLRHRYASRIYAATGDVLAVQQLLGHASLATTQVYLGIGDDRLIAAAATAA